MQIWGMGIASQDLTGDGRPEVVLTSQGDNKLQTLDEGATGPSYHDIALERGVTAHRPVTGGDVLPSTAWHPEFADVNNDAFVDLYLSKGNVEAMTEYAAKDPNSLLLGQAGRDVRRCHGRSGHRGPREEPRGGARRPQPRRTPRPGPGRAPGEREGVAERGRRHGRVARAARPLGRGPPPPGGAEPGCDRGLDRAADRRPGDPARGDRRRWPCRRPAGLDPPRPRLRGSRGGPGPMAGRRGRPVAPGEGQRVRAGRAWRIGRDAVEPPEE